MYHRIKNSLDMEILKDNLETENVDGYVIKRLEELVTILDREYGICRGSSDMGGYILLFTEKQTYEKYFPKIMELHHLDKDLCEYSEQISDTEDGRTEWCEELYLLSSDDALVLIHPTA